MPSSNRGAHPYQRFIPREEVQAVTAWAFEPVDERERAAAEPPPEPAITPEDVERCASRGVRTGFRARAPDRRPGERATR
jgi:flagellar assembly protein FliH